MDKKPNSGKKSKIGQFFSRLIADVDKKMEEKAKSSKCCSGNKDGDKTCCS